MAKPERTGGEEEEEKEKEREWRGQDRKKKKVMFLKQGGKKNKTKRCVNKCQG